MSGELNIMESRFARQLALTGPQKEILASIRFQDQDQSVKGGALLAYSGLIIATVMVQLSAPQDSLVYVSNRFLFVILCFLGLFCMLAAALLSLRSLVVTRPYSQSTEEAIIEFDNLVKLRRRLIKAAFWFCLVGSVLAIVPLIYIAIGNLAR